MSTFIAASFLGRGTRFLIEGIIIMALGGGCLKINRLKGVADSDENKS